MKKAPTISVIGTGYVGLVTGVCFASLGVSVVAYDLIQEKITQLQEGRIPIYEPGLEELLANSRENIRFTHDLDDAISAADIIFVCVGTPQGADGRADLSQVEGVARTIAAKLDRYRLIVEKSTVPVRTAEWIRRTIRLYAAEAEFDVASNPEFLREGSAVADFLHPDRIVVGVDSERAAELLRRLYKAIDAPLLQTNVATAEIIKHASNSFLATKISFINMVSDLCEKTGADIRMVAAGMGLDKRIGRAFLNAGIGYGGSCFPKDVLAFLRIAEDHGVDFTLLEQVHKINQARIPWLLMQMKKILWVLKDKKIALWGASFKPNTDDIREAPALRIVQELLAEGATVQLYDPKGAELLYQALGKPGAVQLCADPLAAAQGAHALVLVTEWQEFLDTDPHAVRKAMETPIVIDGRNMLNESDWRAAGFEFSGVGF